MWTRVCPSYEVLAKFSHRGQRTKVEILQMEWEDDGVAGGRAIDAAVAKQAALQHTGKLNSSSSPSSSWFGKGSKVSPADALLQMPKSAAKLLAAARKNKEVLSANKDTTISINTITPDGADLKASITRGEMEVAAAPAIARAAAPLRRLLRRRAQLPSPADAVEIIGGGAR